MKLSEVTTDIVANYIRVESTDVLLPAILSAAIQYCVSYTGRTKEELEQYEDIPLAVMALCAELYDLRQFTVSSNANMNPTTIQILNAYCVNFL